MRSSGALFACLAFSLASLQIGPSQAPSGQTVPPPPTQSPQLIPRSHEERELRYQAAHRIILNVRVSDASGKAATDLNQKDFTLLEDHQPRKIESFRSVQGVTTIAPVDIVLMLDTVNNSSRRLEYFRKEIERYLKQGEGLLTYPVSIALFSTSGVSADPPTQNRNALLEKLKSLTGSLHRTGCDDNASQSDSLQTPGVIGLGGVRAETSGALACLNQRFTSSVEALNHLALQEVNDPQRVIVVWIGNGWPLLTDREFRADTAEIRQNFFHRLVVLSTALREAQVTLDAISSPDLLVNPESREAHLSDFFNGVVNESQAHAGSLSLLALAHQSGGQVLYSKDIANEVSACIADAESYYALSFDSPPAAEFGEYHSLEVKVNRPELQARTSTLYYAAQ